MVHLVVALPSEAKPLVAHYRLKMRPGNEPFPLFEGNERRLIVSGVGKVASAAATAYLHARTGQQENVVWFNVGIGGHREHPLGYAILAHKITDHATGQSWYPPLIGEIPCKTGSVLTVDRSEKKYGGLWVYDMEASAFIATASRFSTIELVRCYKIISDNSTSPLSKIQPESIEGLVLDHLLTLDSLMKSGEQLANKLTALESDPPEFEKFLGHWRFTVTEKHRLRRLLRQWQTLASGHAGWSEELENLKRSREVLAWIERRICEAARSTKDGIR